MNQIGRKYFSAIAASSNPARQDGSAFERLLIQTGTRPSNHATPRSSGK